jgi:hypothetical protein
MVVIPPDFYAQSVYIAPMNSVFARPPKCCCPVAKKFQVFVAIALFTAAARATNLDVQWDNGAGNNDWGNAINWSGNALPSTGTGTTGGKIHINLSGASRAIYFAAMGANTYQLIRVGDSASGELQVTGGSLASSSTTPSYIGANSIGTINLSGGTLDSARNATIDGVTSVSICFGDGSNALGNLILSGGELPTAASFSG